MPGWNGSNRRDRLPANWEAIRRQVLNAPNGRKCKFENAYGELTCDEPATDVDHIRPGDDHSLGNLRSLCEYHHDQKSGAEGARARAAQRRKINQKFRRREDHPGLL